MGWIEIKQEKQAERNAVGFIATENISAFNVVTASGQVADSSIVSHRGKVIGLSIEPVLIGHAGEAVNEGEVENTAWSFTTGSPLYLDLNGGLTAIAPSSGFSQQIAVATASNKIDIDLKPSILL